MHRRRRPTTVRPPIGPGALGNSHPAEAGDSAFGQPARLRTGPAGCRSRIWPTSHRLQQLIRDGKLYISLQDAIDLALENNLDLAIARYNLPIADTDILRTKAGGFFRGVNTGVVQGTPGGGVGGFGTGAPSGGGAGGTAVGAGGAGAGASGSGAIDAGHRNACFVLRSHHQRDQQPGAPDQPLANLQIYGVPQLQLNTGLVES